MLKNLLIYRLVIFNSIACGLLFWSYDKGLLLPAFQTDKSYMTYAIVAMFVYGMFALFRRAWKTSQGLNALKNGQKINFNEIKNKAKFDHVVDIASYLVNLGLVGTVVGFLILFSGIDINNPDFSDALPGLQTAFYTTLVGIGAWFWYSINLRMVQTAMTCLIEDLKK